jgi:hypothetical protein
MKNTVIHVRAKTTFVDWPSTESRLFNCFYVFLYFNHYFRKYFKLVYRKTSRGKAVPQHTYAGAEGERRYSSYSFSTSALDGGERSASRPGYALPSRIGPPVPIVVGWTLEPV